MKKAECISWRQISGEPCRGEETGLPERPYIHDYTKSLVMKVFLSEPGEREGESCAALDFEGLGSLIRQLDELTRHMPKIIYLVGWQYNGHDDKYPAFFRVNDNLKKEGDKNGAESLVRLMEEARAYHTTVSLHINMTDAYEDSPLWEEYCARGLIARKEDESLMDIGKWGHYRKKTAYQINYTKEWESGFAKERIDRLLACLPVEKAGTIHIDAYFAREGLDSELESERSARRKVCRYFRERGIDVTTEFLYGDGGDGGRECAADGKSSGLIGLVPYIWHFNQSLSHALKRPAGLLTGAAANPDVPYGGEEGAGFLFGESIHGEDIFFRREKGYRLNPDWESEFKRQFCLKTLLWAYQNQYEKEELCMGGKGNRLVYAHGLEADWDRKEITQNGRMLRCNEDVFVPVIWKEKPEILAYSVHGYTGKEWRLPEAFPDTGRVSFAEVTKAGPGPAGLLPVVKGCVSLTLKAGQLVLIQAQSL